MAHKTDCVYKQCTSTSVGFNKFQLTSTRFSGSLILLSWNHNTCTSCVYSSDKYSAYYQQPTPYKDAASLMLTDDVADEYTFTVLYNVYMYVPYRGGLVERCVPDPTASTTAVSTCPQPCLACACSERSGSAWLEARLPCRKCFPSGSECICRSIYNRATPMLRIRDEVRSESKLLTAGVFIGMP